MKRHILYVSTTLPTPGFGSSVIIYRHLKRLKNWKISIIVFPQEIKKQQDIPKEWQIVTINERKWWWPPLKYGMPVLTHLRLKLLIEECKPFFKNNKPDAILNHFGKNSLLAYTLSRKWRSPLYLIFHDRYEVWAKKQIDKHINRKMAGDILNHASRLWFVSEELKDFYKLNRPDNIGILPPMPEGNKLGFARWRDFFKDKPVVAFAGSFHSPQLVHFRNFALVLQKVKGKLLIVSKKNDIIKNSLSGIKNIEYHDPFPRNEDVIKFFVENASCVLVPDSIDPQAAGNRLSFPSRLVEFSHLGLPVLIISPRGTALANWANNHSWLGYLENSENPELTEKIGMLLDKDSWDKMAKQSRDAALNEFNPDKIQEQFERELAVA